MFWNALKSLLIYLDDNIHKSEALKRVGQTNIRTCSVSKLSNQNIKYKSQNKILSKLNEKLLKYRIMFKDIIPFLGLEYKYALLITMNFVVLGISIPKIRSIKFF